MKSLLGIIHLLICFELIVAPLAPNLRFISSGAALAQDCPQGLVMHPTLKRCMVSNQAAGTVNKASQCDELNKSAKDKEKCYRKEAEDRKSEVMKGELSTFDGMQTATNVINSANIGLLFAVLLSSFDSIKHSKCSSISYTALVAGGLALLGGELLANYQHGSRLDDIQKSWNKIINPEHQGETDGDKRRAFSTEAQKEAFYHLAKKEQSYADAMTMKTWFYGAAGVAFAVSGGLAIYELLNPTHQADSYCAVKKDVEAKQAADAAKAAEAAKAADAAKAAGGAVPTGGAADPVAAPKYHENEKREWNYDQLNASSETDWEGEIMKQKHLQNILRSQDLASYYVLSKATEYKNSSPTLDDYETLKRYTTETNLDETIGGSEGLNYLKTLTTVIMNQLSPIASALAAEAEDKDAKEADQQKSYAKLALLYSGLGAAGTGVVVWGIQKLAGDGFTKALMTAPGRLVWSGLLVGWSVTMIVWLQNQKAEAEDRRDKLRTLGDNFEDAANAVGACKSEDRNNPEKPDCYCYTPEGQRNSNRGNSAICQGIWGPAPDTSSGDYLADGSEPKGCVDSNGQPDPKCACRKSSRACLKSMSAVMPKLNLGSFRRLGAELAPLEKITHGAIGKGDASPADMGMKAMRIQKANKKLLNDPKLKKVADVVGKQSKAIATNLNNSLANVPATIPPATPSSPAAAVAELEKELKEHKEELKGALGANATAPKTVAPEYGMTEEDLTLQQGQVAEAMKQDLDYGQNDISAGKNIFETLSNRYQRSGLRRLFDEEGKAKADKPAASDIGQK